MKPSGDQVAGSVVGSVGTTLRHVPMHELPAIFRLGERRGSAVWQHVLRTIGMSLDKIAFFGTDRKRRCCPHLVRTVRRCLGPRAAGVLFGKQLFYEADQLFTGTEHGRM